MTPTTSDLPTTRGSPPASGPPVGIIVAGVLVPLLVIFIGVVIFLCWYRKKYPMRTQVGGVKLGPEFSRYTNPAYHKKTGTLSLIRDRKISELEGTDNLAFENEQYRGPDSNPYLEVQVNNGISNTENTHSPKKLVIAESPKKSLLVGPEEVARGNIHDVSNKLNLESPKMHVASDANLEQGSSSQVESKEPKVSEADVNRVLADLNIDESSDTDAKDSSIPEKNQIKPDAGQCVNEVVNADSDKVVSVISQETHKPKTAGRKPKKLTLDVEKTFEEVVEQTIADTDVKDDKPETVEQTVFSQEPEKPETAEKKSKKLTLEVEKSFDEVAAELVGDQKMKDVKSETVEQTAFVRNNVLNAQDDTNITLDMKCVTKNREPFSEHSNLRGNSGTNEKGNTAPDKVTSQEAKVTASKWPDTNKPSGEETIEASVIQAKEVPFEFSKVVVPVILKDDHVTANQGSIGEQEKKMSKATMAEIAAGDSAVSIDPDVDQSQIRQGIATPLPAVDHRINEGKVTDIPRYSMHDIDAILAETEKIDNSILKGDTLPIDTGNARSSLKTETNVVDIKPVSESEGAAFNFTVDSKGKDILKSKAKDVVVDTTSNLASKVSDEGNSLISTMDRSAAKGAIKNVVAAQDDKKSEDLKATKENIAAAKELHKDASTDVYDESLNPFA